MSGGRSNSATAWSGGVTAEDLVQVGGSRHAWHGSPAPRNCSAIGIPRSAAGLGPGLDHLVQDAAQLPGARSVVGAFARLVGAAALSADLLCQSRVAP